MTPDAVRDSINRMTPGGYRRRRRRWPGLIAWLVLIILLIGALHR